MQAFRREFGSNPLSLWFGRFSVSSRSITTMYSLPTTAHPTRASSRSPVLRAQNLRSASSSFQDRRKSSSRMKRLLVKNPEVRKDQNERMEIDKIAAINVQNRDQDLIESAEMLALEDARAAGGRFDNFRGGFFDDVGSRPGGAGEFAALPTADVSSSPNTWFETSGDLGGMQASNFIARGKARSSRRFADVENASGAVSSGFRTESKLELQDTALNFQYGARNPREGPLAMDNHYKRRALKMSMLRRAEWAATSKKKNKHPEPSAAGPIALSLTSPEHRKQSEEEWEQTKKAIELETSLTVSESTGAEYHVFSKRSNDDDWFCHRCASINPTSAKICPHCGHRKDEVYFRGSAQTKSKRVICLPGSWKCTVCSKMNYEHAAVSELAEKPGYADDLLKLYSALKSVDSKSLLHNSARGYLSECKYCDAEKYHSSKVLGVLRRRNSGDWFCPKCSTHLTQYQLTCTNCGFERPDKMSDLETDIRRRKGDRLCAECGAVLEKGGQCRVCRLISDRTERKLAAEKKKELLEEIERSKTSAGEEEEVLLSEVSADSES